MFQKFYTKKFISLNGFLGYSRQNWHPSSEKFLAGYRNKISIFEVSTSSFYFRRAISFVERTFFNQGRFFVYGPASLRNLPLAASFSAFNQVTAFSKWQGGFVTNTRRFPSAIVINKGRHFSAVIGLAFSYKNASLAGESARISLPLIAPVDSNTDPSYVTYPIPSNLQDFGAVVFYCSEVLQRFYAAAFSKIRLMAGRRHKNSKVVTGGRQLNDLRGSMKFNKNNRRSFIGRRWNRTTAVSFSGLNSTIELSPLLLKNY